PSPPSGWFPRSGPMPLSGPMPRCGPTQQSGRPTPPARAPEPSGARPQGRPCDAFPRALLSDEFPHAAPATGPLVPPVGGEGNPLAAPAFFPSTLASFAWARREPRVGSLTIGARRAAQGGGAWIARGNRRGEWPGRLVRGRGFRYI